MFRIADGYAGAVGGWVDAWSESLFDEQLLVLRQWVGIAVAWPGGEFVTELGIGHEGVGGGEVVPRTVHFYECFYGMVFDKWERGFHESEK